MGCNFIRAGNGGIIHVREPRKYCPVRNKELGSRIIEPSTDTLGLEACAFTFVSGAM